VASIVQRNGAVHDHLRALEQAVYRIDASAPGGLGVSRELTLNGEPERRVVLELAR
jgi:hypothetical protein